MEQLLLIYKSNIFLKDICFNILLVLKDLTYHIDIFTDLLEKKKYQIVSFYINADVKNFNFDGHYKHDSPFYNFYNEELCFIVIKFLVNNPLETDFVNLLNNEFAENILFRAAFIYWYNIRCGHGGGVLCDNEDDDVWYTCYTKITKKEDKLRNIMMKLKHRVTEKEWRYMVRDFLINDPDLHNY